MIQEKPHRALAKCQGFCFVWTYGKNVIKWGLDEGLRADYKLTRISAPAGFGQTALPGGKNGKVSRETR
jgi:hypothetical protein